MLLRFVLWFLCIPWKSCCPSFHPRAGRCFVCSPAHGKLFRLRAGTSYALRAVARTLRRTACARWRTSCGEQLVRGGAHLAANSLCAVTHLLRQTACARWRTSCANTAVCKLFKICNVVKFYIFIVFYNIPYIKTPLTYMKSKQCCKNFWISQIIQHKSELMLYFS